MFIKINCFLSGDMSAEDDRNVQTHRVWIISYLPAMSGRGIEKVVDALAGILRRNRYDVRIVDADSLGLWDSPFCRIRPYVSWRIGRILNTLVEPEDIIICNSYFSWNARRSRSLVIYHQTERERAISNRGLRSPLLNLAVYTIGAWLDKLCGAERTIVAVSPSVKDEVEKHYHLTVDRVIANAVDTATLSPAKDKVELRLSLGLPVNEFLVLHAGPSDKQKGLGFVVEQVLPRMGDGHRLVIVSDTAQRPDRAIVVGRQGFEAMTKFIRACDVLLMPSLYEGFGLTVAEALACGVPSVVSPTGLGKDLLKDDVLGRYVIPLDKPDLYASRLEELRSSSTEWNRVSEASRSFAEKNLGLDRFEREYLQLLKDLR